MARLRDKVAIITGGASGIGSTTAELFAQQGAAVVVADVNERDGAEVAARLAGASFRVHDAGDEASWEGLMAYVLDRYGHVDILINNAAITGIDGPVADPETTTVENWRAVHRVNSEGVFLGCKHAIAAMKNRGGSIVNVSSGGAIIPSPMNTPYGAAKAGILNLTITVAIHCATRGYGIRCNAVLPGGTRTPMLLGLFDSLVQAKGANAADIEREFAQHQTLHRLAEPGEIANTILFLASDEASYVNAEFLVVDGGGRYPTMLS